MKTQIDQRGVILMAFHVVEMVALLTLLITYGLPVWQAFAIMGVLSFLHGVALSLAGIQVIGWRERVRGQ